MRRYKPGKNCCTSSSGISCCCLGFTLPLTVYAHIIVTNHSTCNGTYDIPMGPAYNPGGNSMEAGWIFGSPLFCDVVYLHLGCSDQSSGVHRAVCDDFDILIGTAPCDWVMLIGGIGAVPLGMGNMPGGPLGGGSSVRLLSCSPFHLIIEGDILDGFGTGDCFHIRFEITE